MVLLSEKISYFLMRLTAFIVLKICFRFRVYGQENIISLKSPFILASNHQSYLDPIILTCSTDKFVKFMARESLFENYIFAKLISHLGALPIDLKTSKVGLIKKFYKLLKAGENLVIFPEGTRSPEGVIKGGQPGIGYLMSKANVSVVPVFIENSGKALAKKNKWIRLCKINAIIGEPITPEVLNNKFENIKDSKTKYKLYADYIMQRIKKIADERSNII